MAFEYYYGQPGAQPAPISYEPPKQQNPMDNQFSGLNSAMEQLQGTIGGTVSGGAGFGGAGGAAGAGAGGSFAGGGTMAGAGGQAVGSMAPGMGGGLTGLSGGGAGGGAGGAMAAGGPWAALAAVIVGNEMGGKKQGRRSEGADYYKDLSGGYVFGQDVDAATNKVFGGREDDRFGFGNEMKAIGNLSSGDFGNAWKDIQEGTLGRAISGIGGLFR